MKHIVSALLFELIAIAPTFAITLTRADCTIIVFNQEDFDVLNCSIKKAISDKHKAIEVKINLGQYYFSERQINLEVGRSGIMLSIIGNGCTLVGKPSNTISDRSPLNVYNF